MLAPKLVQVFFASRTQFDYSNFPTCVEQIFGEINEDISENRLLLNSELILEKVVSMLEADDECKFRENFYEHHCLFKDLISAFHNKAPLDTAEYNTEYYDWLYVLAYKTHYPVYKLSTIRVDLTERFQVSRYGMILLEKYDDVFILNSTFCINGLPAVEVQTIPMCSVLNGFGLIPVQDKANTGKEKKTLELLDNSYEVDSSLKISTSLFKEQEELSDNESPCCEDNDFPCCKDNDFPCCKDNKSLRCDEKIKRRDEKSTCRDEDLEDDANEVSTFTYFTIVLISYLYLDKLGLLVGAIVLCRMIINYLKRKPIKEN